MCQALFSLSYIYGTKAVRNKWFIQVIEKGDREAGVERRSARPDTRLLSIPHRVSQLRVTYTRAIKLCLVPTFCNCNPRWLPSQIIIFTYCLILSNLFKYKWCSFSRVSVVECLSLHQGIPNLMLHTSSLKLWILVSSSVKGIILFISELFVPNIIPVIIIEDFIVNSHLINRRANDNLVVQICQGFRNAIFFTTLSHDLYSKEVLNHTTCVTHYKLGTLCNLQAHDNTT